MNPVQLRLMTFEDVQNNTLLLRLPVVYSGNMEECNRYAINRGFQKKDSKKELYGFYYYNKNDGKCLLLT